MLRRSVARWAAAGSGHHHQGGGDPSMHHYGGGGGGPPMPPYPQPPMPPPPPPPHYYERNRHQLDPRAFINRVPINTVVNIVPQGSFYVVERLGKYYKTMEPGIHFTMPVIDKIRYVYSSKEQGILIPDQSAITKDNVMVEIDGVLFLRIIDAEKASYNIDNPIFNLINLAQTTMRSEIGKMKLDTLFEERDQLNSNIIEVIKREAWEWGVECKRYEIRDIAVSDIVRRSMDLQAEAERKKRKLILESEGDSLAERNRAEGRRYAMEHLAEGEKYAVLRAAEGRAEAVAVAAEASKTSARLGAEALEANPLARDAVALRLAEKYIEQFGNIAKEGNTVVLSKEVGDPASFTANAMAMFKGMASGGAVGGAGSGTAALPPK